VEGDGGDRKPGCTFFWKKDRESLSRLSVNEFKLATNNMLGYDMPRVTLKIISSFDGRTYLVLVEHELVDFDGRLLSVILLDGVDRITKQLQLVLTFTVRLQPVLKHLLADRRELLFIRISTATLRTADDRVLITHSTSSL